MTDIRNPYIAAKYAPAALAPTEKAPGHKVLSLHRVQVINEHGGVEPQPISHPNAGPAMPLHVAGLRITDACLAGMAVLIVIIFGALAADYLGVW